MECKKEYYETRKSRLLKFYTIGEVKWIIFVITKAIDCPNCNKKLDSVVEGRKTKMQ